MKNNKFMTAALAVIAIIVLAASLSACVTEEDKQIDEAFALAAKGDYLKVEVSDDNGVFYIYDNGVVTDLYDLGIKFEEVVGQKGEAFRFTSKNLKEGYVCEKNTASGKISLSAELVGTSSLAGGIDGAKVVLVANTVTKEVTTFTVTYTDEKGYKVRITLA